MQSTLILCCVTCLTAALAYYILYGIAKLLETLMKNSGQALKSIALLLTLVCLLYIVINRNNSDQMLNDVIEYVTFWDDNSSRNSVVRF